MSRRRTREGYDRVAGRYAAEIGGELAGKPLDRALLDAFVELAGGPGGADDPDGSGGVVLDVGCGPGHVTAHLAGRGASAVGLDLSPAMGAEGVRATGLPFAAADMTALPVRAGAVAGVASLYAVIHLDGDGRAAAYREFARVVRPGGPVLVAFHVSDDQVPAGGTVLRREWWGHEVELTFAYLEPEAEVRALAAAGLDLVARLDRGPAGGFEHPSRRCYLLARRP